MPGLPAASAVELLSQAAGERYRAIGPLAGGETGANEVAGPDDRRYVLKSELDPDNAAARRVGARLAERLRAEAGWPSPRQWSYEADDCLLVLQELLPGAPVVRLTHELVDELFDLHERRLQLATEPASGEWAEELLETLVRGGRGYCRHEPLREHSERTRRIVERIESIGRSLRPDDVAGHDIVHADLHLGNLLQVDDRLTAVIDMDYTRVGDATFDLATLAISALEADAAPDVCDRLVDRGIDALPQPKRDAYVSNLLLRCLDWPIRKGRTDEVEFWIPQAERLLGLD